MEIMKALRTVSVGKLETVDIPIPSLEGLPGFVLVKTKYVGISPSDNAFLNHPVLFVQDITIGADFSGEVVAVSPGYTRLKKGDRVAGANFPSGPAMPNAGCHAEYTLAKGDVLLKLDELGGQVSDAQGAALGIALYTVFMSLYNLMGLPQPGAPGDRGTILVYGGSTVSGMMTVQWAKLSRMRVITTCSPKNFDLLRSLGADAALDYHDPEKCVNEIRGEAPDVKLVLDCIGTEDSVRICDDVMAQGAKYFSLTLSRSKREDITSAFVSGSETIGEPVKFGGQTVPANPETFEKGKLFLELSSRLISEGKIKPAPVEVHHGLEKVPGLMVALQEGRNSALKYVCSV